MTVPGFKQPTEVAVPIAAEDTTAEQRLASLYTVTSWGNDSATVFAPLLEILIVPPIVPVANKLVSPQKSTRSRLPVISRFSPRYRYSADWPRHFSIWLTRPG